MSSCVCLNHSGIYKNYFILPYEIKIKIFHEQLYLAGLLLEYKVLRDKYWFLKM